MTTPNDSWKTPELRAAEAQVDARFKEAQDLANANPNVIEAAPEGGESG